MPSSKIVPTYPQARYKTISCIGDSLTRNLNYGVSAYQLWPELLCNTLRGLNPAKPVQGRNLGRAGNTTTDMVNRSACITQVDHPSIQGSAYPILGIIEGGVNDPGGSISSSTTTANIITLANIYLNAGVQMVVITSAHYLNFSSGGDTQTVPYSTYVPVRAAQLAAYNTLVAANPGKIAFCDWHQYFSNLIANGTEVQGSASWHFTDGNQHFNILGNTYAAAAMYQTISNQTGWLAALS